MEVTVTKSNLMEVIVDSLQDKKVSREKIDDGETAFQTILDSCLQEKMDVGTLAFMAYDTCGKNSPVRNCTAGKALYYSVIQSFLGIPIAENVKLAQNIRDRLRGKLLRNNAATQETGFVGSGLMEESIRSCLETFTSKQQDQKGGSVVKRGKEFMKDVMPGRVGTNFRRDPALEELKSLFYNRDLASSMGWSQVQFPIVFHIQWDVHNDPKSKPKMLFHVTFDPWATACGLALSILGTPPPVQIRETPYKDKHSDPIAYQPPRKYIIDWDLYVLGNLGKAGPVDMFTEDYLLDMFIRSLAVIHMYMRILNVLPSKKDLCISIKKRTRKTRNKEVCFFCFFEIFFFLEIFLICFFMDRV